MKKYHIPALLLSLLSLTACEKFSDAGDAEEIQKISVNVNTTISVENVTVKSLKVKFVNYAEGLTFEKESTGSSSISVDDIIPGLYTITASCVATDAEGGIYYMAGSLSNKGVFPDEKNLDIEVLGTKAGDIVFKEVYFSGSDPWYFRDQFYELYNNTNKVQYLDGLYFANLNPSKATEVLPVYPAEDGNNYGYAQRVWKFPGDGDDYPLQPGESCIIAQWATNHQIETLNPNSPVNCESAEFEFFMNHSARPDQPAYNMEHVFYDGKSQLSGAQYLTSVFGGAYVLFKVPDGETYDPCGDPNLHTPDLSISSPTLYAKVPVRYIIDGVEAIDNEAMAAAKRCPATIDAGMTWVGDTYIGKSVVRKRATDENGNFVMLDNGSFSYQDTNNSTDDFDRGFTPMFRRYNDEDNNADSGMPSWNHTLQ